MKSLLRQRPIGPLSPILQHRADVNKTFQSLDNKKESQSILQFIRLFNLHKDGYNFSDAQMKIQLYKKVGNKEKTHLELINFEQASFTFEDIVDSLVVEFEGVSRVEDAVRAFTLFSPHEGESFSELKTRLKEVLEYLKRVGGSEHIIPCFMVLDTIRRFLPNQYQNYMAQLNNNLLAGLDEVGIVYLVFGHLAIFDLNRSFRSRQNTGRFNQRGRGGRGYSNYRGRASRGNNNRQHNQSQHGNRSVGSNIDCYVCGGNHYASDCDKKSRNNKHNNNNIQPHDNRLHQGTDRINCIKAIREINTVNDDEDMTNHVLVEISNCQVSALVDSGATCNVMSLNLADQFGEPIQRITKKARLPDNKIIQAVGIVELPFRLASDQDYTNLRFWVFTPDSITEDTVILGEPFISSCDYVHVKPKVLGWKNSHFRYGMIYRPRLVEEVNVVDIAPESSYRADDLFVEQLPDFIEDGKIISGSDLSKEERAQLIVVIHDFEDIFAGLLKTMIYQNL